MTRRMRGSYEEFAAGCEARTFISLKSLVTLPGTSATPSADGNPATIGGISVSYLYIVSTIVPPVINVYTVKGRLLFNIRFRKLTS